MEIIPKPAQKLPLWQNILFYLSLALLVASIFSFFLLERSLKNSKSSLRNLEETLTREKTPREVNLEKDILSWQKKIRNFSQLFSEHLYSSNGFDFIEDITHPQVWLKQISMDSKESKIVASGHTESFTTLGQQLLILEKEPKIESFNLSSLTIGEKGGVNFNLSLSLDPEIFR